MSEGTRRVLLVLLLAAAVVPYFVGLGDSAIWDANEAFYVETPREMIERGDYVSPTFNYETRLNKPVLSYWIVAGFYRLFGISVGVQRLTIALGALGLVAVAFFLARLAWPEGLDRSGPRNEAALWAAIGLAVAPRLLMLARRIFIDIYISLFMALTLLCFAASERYPARRRLFLVLMYVSIGLGMLTKGPVAVVVPGLAFAVYLIVHRELRRVAAMMIPTGALIVLAIVVPWYAALYVRDGWTYIVSFFVGENVDRFTSGLGVRVERPWYFYFPVVFSDSFPWSLYLVPAAIALWRERRSRPAADSSRRVRTLFFIWILVIVGFFSLSAGKQDLYIFPIVPAVAALAGWVLARATREQAPVGAARTTAGIAGVLLVVGAGLLYLFQTAGGAYAIEGVAAIGGIGVVSGAAAVWLAWKRRVFHAAATLALAVIALNVVFVLRTLPSFEAYKPVPGFADTIARHASRDGQEEVVATYDQSMPSLVFYLRRHVDELFDADRLVDLWRSGKRIYLVVSAEDFDKVKGQLPGDHCVIDRRPTFDVRLRNILAREALPQLIVVSNRCSSR
jgi:4-amino-4-deoxy-L-arabinose transferase-like glycosyltransferase